MMLTLYAKESETTRYHPMEKINSREIKKLKVRNKTATRNSRPQHRKSRVGVYWKSLRTSGKSKHGRN